MLITLWKFRNRKNWELYVNELRLMVVCLIPLSLLMLNFVHIAVLSTLHMNLCPFVVVKAKLKLIWMSILRCLMPFSHMEVRLECIFGSIIVYTTICLHSVHLEVWLMLVPTKAFMSLSYMANFIIMFQAYCPIVLLNPNFCNFIFWWSTWKRESMWHLP